MAAHSIWRPYLQLVPKTVSTESSNVAGDAISAGYGSGGGNTTVDAETKNYLDAKMEAVKAQNDARFSEVLSRLDGIKDLPKFWPLVAAIAIAAVTIIGISVTILSYASDRFDGGLGASSLVDAITREQAERDAAQDAKLDKILGKLETLSVVQTPKP